MQTVVDERLEREALEYRLRFTCEHCAHFVTEARACAEGYPNREHVGVDLDRRRTIAFCKSFELG